MIQLALWSQTEEFVGDGLSLNFGFANKRLAWPAIVTWREMD